MYKKTQLKNKTNVYLIPLENTQAVTVLVMFPVGSRYESSKLNGVSHFIEHLMFKGTKKRPNTLTLTREIDRLGAEYNAFTSKEYTGYYIKTDAKYLETAVDILSDMLFSSKFDAREMEKEKTVIVEELRTYKDNPIMNIENVFEELMFDGCPLAWDIGGTEKHVMNYKREDVLKFKKRYYCPENTTIVVAGNIDENINKILTKYFDGRKSGGVLGNQFKPAKFGVATKKRRLRVEHKKTDQAQMMLGFSGFHYNHKSSPVLAVLNTILGGSMSSRLFIQIRERRGLAYMIRSGSDSFRDIGYVYVRVGLEVKNINKAIEVIKQELEKIKSKGVTKKELQDAKTHIRGGLSLSMEDSGAQASWYARQALFADKIKTPEQKLAKIDKVTNQEIIALANKIFDFDKMRVAVIGDVKREEIEF
ncbi:insulinase family protein [Patescibacteria group bacterium]|nr:insulinase family protein [Patescibacteria group bacterium]